MEVFYATIERCVHVSHTFYMSHNNNFMNAHFPDFVQALQWKEAGVKLVLWTEIFPSREIDSFIIFAYIKHFDLLLIDIYYYKYPLDCSTKNVIYGIECTFCGLLYVGETRQILRSRMSQHRYDANDPKYRILHNHFNQPGHDRCLTMKVRIIEKIYHYTNRPILSTPYRTDREWFLIKS